MSTGATSQLLKVYMSQAPDSDGVAELQLRKQTPLDRIYMWLTRRSVPTIGSWKYFVNRLIDSVTFSVIVVVMTFLALFLVDISILTTTSPDIDGPVQIVIFVCFVFFLLEIFASILVQDEYFLSFFFACDLIGTVSLLFDISWISTPIGLNFSSGSTAILRASRVARTGTRATRVLRLLRTMRMPALLRCCKSRQETFDDVDDVAESDALQQQQTTSSPSDGGTAQANAEERARLKRVRAKQRQQAADKHQQTNVGTKLQLVVSKRVIFLVTIMIFCIPLLTDSDVDHSRALALNLLEYALVAAPGPPFFGQVAIFRAMDSKLIYLRVYNQTIPGLRTEPDTSEIRGAALLNVTSDSQQSYGLFDNTPGLRTSTLLSLGMTLFTIVLFAGGSVLFTQDAERLFFKPIERMIKTVRRLAQIMFEMEGGGGDGGIGGGGGGGSGPDGTADVPLDETILIEAVVARVSDLFNVRLERDGVKRKTTYMKTVGSRWRIHIEEEECAAPVDLSVPVKNKDLLLIHEIEELASLSRCLDSPTCTLYLAQFLRHAYCVESLLFLTEVRAYRAAAERLHHQARQIYRLFISDQAVNQVAVEWGARRAVSQNLKTQMAQLADLFAMVEKEVLVQLTRDAFPRFLNSIYCLRLLKHLTLERRGQKRQRAVQAAAAVQAQFERAQADDQEEGGGGGAIGGGDAFPGGHLEMRDVREIQKALEKQ